MQIDRITTTTLTSVSPEVFTIAGTFDGAVEYLKPLAKEAWKGYKRAGKGAIVLNQGKGAYVPNLTLYDWIKPVNEEMAQLIAEYSRRCLGNRFVLVQVVDENIVDAYLVTMDQKLEEIAEND